MLDCYEFTQSTSVSQKMGELKRFNNDHDVADPLGFTGWEVGVPELGCPNPNRFKGKYYDEKIEEF